MVFNGRAHSRKLVRGLNHTPSDSSPISKQRSRHGAEKSQPHAERDRSQGEGGKRRETNRKGGVKERS